MKIVISVQLKLNIGIGELISQFVKNVQGKGKYQNYLNQVQNISLVQKKNIYLKFKND